MAKVTKKGIVQDDWLYGTPFTCRWCHAEFVLERGVDHPQFYHSHDFNQKYNISHANINCPECRSYTQIDNPLHKPDFMLYDTDWEENTTLVGQCAKELFYSRHKQGEDDWYEVTEHVRQAHIADALVVLREAFKQKQEYESWEDDRDWSDD